MKSTAAGVVPNVVLISDHASFRSHFENWLPSPAVNLVEAGPEDFTSRLYELPPQLLVFDRAVPDLRALLSRAAALVPGVPYLVVSTEKLDPQNSYLFDIASGYVAGNTEVPTREAIMSAIARVAPHVSARLR